MPIPESDDNKNAVDILLKEYDQLYLEIRNIHDKRLSFFKILTAAFMALMGYVFAGIIFYVQNGGRVPGAIVFVYGCLGLIFTISVYMLAHNMFHYLGPSKKHTVRYWKAIHAIRLGFKELVPQTNKYLILPDSERNPGRPRLSHRWGWGVVILPLYHLMFYFLIALLVSPWFAEQVESKLILDKVEIVELSLLLCLPIVLLPIARGANTMLGYARDIEDARYMVNDNVYAHAKKKRKKRRYIRVGWWLNAAVIFYSILVFLSVILRKWGFDMYLNHVFEHPRWVVFISILLVLFGDSLYLFGHRFLPSITWRKRTKTLRMGPFSMKI